MMPTATGAEGSRRPSVDLDAPKLSDEESDDQDVSRRTSEADTTSDATQLLSGPDADEATAEQRGRASHDGWYRRCCLIR